jgi:hypothetical protein
MQNAPGRLTLDRLSGFARRIGEGPIAALVLLATAIVLVGLTTTLSWYDISTYGRPTEFHLAEICFGMGCAPYRYPPYQDVFGVAYALVLGSAALGIAALALCVLSVRWQRARVAALIAGILGSFLILIVPTYLYLAIPGTLSPGGYPTGDSFFGASELPSGEVTWGGGVAWYLAFVAFVMLFVSSLVGFSTFQRLADRTSAKLPS